VWNEEVNYTAYKNNTNQYCPTMTTLGKMQNCVIQEGSRTYWVSKHVTS